MFIVFVESTMTNIVLWIDITWYEWTITLLLAELSRETHDSYLNEWCGIVLGEFTPNSRHPCNKIAPSTLSYCWVGKLTPCSVRRAGLFCVRLCLASLKHCFKLGWRNPFVAAEAWKRDIYITILGHIPAFALYRKTWSYVHIISVTEIYL